MCLPREVEGWGVSMLLASPVTLSGTRSCSPVWLLVAYWTRHMVDIEMHKHEVLVKFNMSVQFSPP